MLKEKYADLPATATRLGITDFAMSEEGGKLKVKGSAEFQLEKDLFWDAIKAHAGWDKEVAADIRASRSDIHGYHVVQSGDTLSKIAKVHLDNAGRYMEIFNANKDQLKDPNLIHPGQKLLIPKR
jgi:LysM repeat protein